jgi:hypothetical protein
VVNNQPAVPAMSLVPTDSAPAGRNP